MTTELTILAVAGLLQFVQWVMLSLSATRELGIGKTASARDEDRLGGPLLSQLSTKPARIYRAYENNDQALILFTVAVVLVELSAQNSGFIATCAYIFIFARVAYVPAYYFGLSPWRSVIWMTGLFATTTMILSTLF